MTGATGIDPSEVAAVPAAHPAVTIGVLTYQRPAGLERIVPRLIAHAHELHPPARVLVIDNDPGGCAEPIVRRWYDQGVTYAHEPRPGIAAARNRALDESSASDALVFIDDDEVPQPGWLRHLVDTWQSTRCVGVAGPVARQFDGDVDPWVMGSGVFDRRRRRTGTAIPGAATSNLLLDVAQVQAYGVRFDESFGLTGGSDTMFTRRLTRGGGVIVWCDEAEVLDFVPAQRATREWVLRRTFRVANGWSRVGLALRGSRLARLHERLDLSARGLALLARGSVRLGWGLVTSNIRHRARGACAVASGAGVLLGAYGYVYSEYVRPVSTPTGQ